MSSLAPSIRSQQQDILLAWHQAASSLCANGDQVRALDAWMRSVITGLCDALDGASQARMSDPLPDFVQNRRGELLGQLHDAIQDVFAAQPQSLSRANNKALTSALLELCACQNDLLVAQNTVDASWSHADDSEQTKKRQLEAITPTHAQRQLSFVVDLAQIGFFDWDILSDKIEFNRYFIRDWQIESGASLETALERIDKRDRVRVSQAIHQAIAQGTHFHADYRVVRPDGITIWIEAQGKVFYDAHGTPERFLGTSRNISKRMAAGEAAQDAHRWLESVLDQIPLPILMVQPKTGNHIFANRAVNAMHGRKLDTGTDSRTYGAAFHVCDGSGRRLGTDELPTTRAARGAQLNNYEITWHTDGRVIDLMMSSVYLPASYGHEAVVVCPFQDVTALKESQRALSRAVADLHVESTLRDKFVSSLSHDLRTPLSAAHMSAQRLERQFAGDERVLRSVQRILRGLGRVDEMIHQMLEVNRIKAGHKLHIRPEDTQLDTLLADSVSELNAMHRGRIEYKNHAQSTQVRCDQQAMRRMLDNLVSNAVKYGDPQGAIRVDVADDSDTLKINVTNQGPLITPDDQINLFKPYFRANDALEGGQTGWGIGLALVKEIAEAHGGDVSVQSTIKHGTTFAITLPRVS